MNQAVRWACLLVAVAACSTVSAPRERKAVDPPPLANAALAEALHTGVEPLAQIQAIIEGPDDVYEKARCQSERPCGEPVRKLPTCESMGDNDRGRPMAEILARAKTLSGGIVRARGALGVGTLVSASSLGGDWFGFETETKAKCDLAVSCCRQLWAPGPDRRCGRRARDRRAVVRWRRVAGVLQCAGVRQTVIATGRLVRELPEQTTVGWRLVNVSVCEVANGR